MKKDNKKIEINSDLKLNFKKLESKYGSLDLSWGSFNQEERSLVKIETSLISLNIILGGGIPMGRLIELYGPESSGKSTLGLQIISDFQRKGMACALIDLERCYISKYGDALGIDNDRLIVGTPLYGEKAFEMIIDLVESMEIKLIVVDSVSALMPKEEVVNNSEGIGLQARMMSKWVRKIIPIIAEKNVTVIFINQIRKQVGSFIIDSETTSGGLALKFFSSIRIELRRTSFIRKQENIVGAEIRLKVFKNKVSAPFRQTILSLYNGEGFCVEADLIKLAEKWELIDKKGSWYEYNEVKLGQGLENAVKYLKDNPKLRGEITKKILKLNEGLTNE